MIHSNVDNKKYVSIFAHLFRKIWMNLLFFKHEYAYYYFYFYIEYVIPQSSTSSKKRQTFMNRFHIFLMLEVFYSVASIVAASCDFAVSHTFAKLTLMIADIV